MARYGLVGDPIAGSPSPAMHEAACAALGLEHTYELRPARLGDAQAVRDELLRGQWQGVNVTTPLKVELSRGVRLIGAAARAAALNTLWVEGGRLVGALTDVDGVREPLSALGVGGAGEALVLGAGGAARAAVVALVELGLTVHVAARRAEAAVELARYGGAAAPALDDAEGLRALFGRGLVAIVQATPVGRGGERLPLPWDALGPGCVAFEMLYRPRRTPFLADAEAAGARLVEGWQMLVEQGARSFELWTGQTPPRAVMREAALRALG